MRRKGLNLLLFLIYCQPCWNLRWNKQSLVEFAVLIVISRLWQVDGILKAVLRDEIIAWHKKTQEDTSMPLSPAGQPENMDSQQLVSLVQKAVTAIMTRLHNLAQFEGGESKVNTLVAAANSLDNLCRMDPAWHPWLWLGSDWDDALHHLMCVDLHTSDVTWKVQ